MSDSDTKHVISIIHIISGIYALQISGQCLQLLLLHCVEETFQTLCIHLLKGTDITAI